jgi:hypothetical protein
MALALPQSDLDPPINRSRFNPEMAVAHWPGQQEPQARSASSFSSVIALPDESLPLKLREPVADLLRIDDQNSLSVDRFTETRPASLATQEQTDNADPLILGEEDINSVRNCAGRDVTIQANNRKLFLVGICRSVTVVGSDDSIMIEISNRGKLTIVGERNVVLWSGGPEGPEPMAMSGDGSNMEIHLPSQSDITVPLVTIEATRLASVPTNP